MGRLVKEREPSYKAISTSEIREDSYPERVAKYVPAEIIAGYTPLIALAAGVGLAPNAAAVMVPTMTTVVVCFVVFLAGLIATPVYLWKTSGPVGQSKKIQVVISTLAFVLWAYVLGGPFKVLAEFMPDTFGYYPAVGGVITGVYTWMVGLFAPEARTTRTTPSKPPPPKKTNPPKTNPPNE